MTLEDRVEALEQKVRILTIKVDKPSQAEIKRWIVQSYGTPILCAEALGISQGYISQLRNGVKDASPRIIDQMIKDGFYNGA